MRRKVRALEAAALREKERRRREKGGSRPRLSFTEVGDPPLARGRAGSRALLHLKVCVLWVQTPGWLDSRPSGKLTSPSQRLLCRPIESANVPRLGRWHALSAALTPP